MARIYKLANKNMAEREGVEEDSYNQDWIVLDEFPNNADVNALLKELTVKELTGKDDEAKLDRIKALLRCELIIFEMYSENNGELVYDYNKVMIGGSDFLNTMRLQKHLR